MYVQEHRFASSHYTVARNSDLCVLPAQLSFHLPEGGQIQLHHKMYISETECVNDLRQLYFRI